MRQAGQNADCDNQGNTIADAALGNLFAQPHQEHGSGSKDDNGLDSIPPDGAVIHHQVALESGEQAGSILPSESHEQTLSEAEQDSQVAAVLHDFRAATFFTRELAEGRNDRREQLNDNSGADVRHDAQSAHCATFQGAAGEHAVHAQQVSRPLLAGVPGNVLSQCSAIQTGNRNHGRNPANAEHHQGEKNPRF